MPLPREILIKKAHLPTQARGAVSAAGRASVSDVVHGTALRMHSTMNAVLDQHGIVDRKHVHKYTLPSGQELRRYERAPQPNGDLKLLLRQPRRPVGPLREE